RKGHDQEIISSCSADCSATLRLCERLFSYLVWSAAMALPSPLWFRVCQRQTGETKAAEKHRRSPNSFLCDSAPLRETLLFRLTSFVEESCHEWGSVGLHDPAPRRRAGALGRPGARLGRREAPSRAQGPHRRAGVAGVPAAA